MHGHRHEVFGGRQFGNYLKENFASVQKLNLNASACGSKPIFYFHRKLTSRGASKTPWKALQASLLLIRNFKNHERTQQSCPWPFTSGQH
jgi:hypothetical protein